MMRLFNTAGNDLGSLTHGVVVYGEPSLQSLGFCLVWRHRYDESKRMGDEMTRSASARQ